MKPEPSSPNHRRSIVARVVGALVITAHVACGGATEIDARGSDGGSQGPGGSCTWPASLDAVDAARGACRAAAALLSCQDGTGTGQFCISNDLTACPNSSGQFKCRNMCNPGEYGASCGTMGGARPPAGCRITVPTPGLIIFYCCPCSS